MKIHGVVGGCVGVLGVYFHLSRWEWAYLLASIFIVIGFELMNTAIEHAVDLVTIQISPMAKLAKDVAAGAVLVMSIHAVIAGSLIFGPRLVTLFEQVKGGVSG